VAQLTLPLETEPALRREDFVVAPGNREAAAFIDAWPDWPSSAAVLHGPEGSGKTHLATAWAARAGGAIVEARAVDESLLAHTAPLAIENVDAEPPDTARERVLFALIERGAPVLFTAREAPSRWRALMPDLASRYRALLAFGLWAPDDGLLAALARKLFADRQLGVPEPAIAHMLNALERSPAAIRDFVARADAKALSERRAVSLALIREMLG
jgi:chromosomal replication initiation ATPase DnaA